jgi:NADH-quinone oxidoreductase subunit D
MNYCSSHQQYGMVDDFRKLLMLKYLNVPSLRVIVMELARITDHLICNSILGVDTGAYTGFLYVFQFREKYMRFMKKFVVLD